MNSTYFKNIHKRSDTSISSRYNLRRVSKFKTKTSYYSRNCFNLHLYLKLNTAQLNLNTPKNGRENVFDRN